MSLSLGSKAMLLKIIQGFGGLALIPLVISNLSAQEQGFYYAFISLIALQVFAELGITGVFVQSVAHEAAHLNFSKKGKVKCWIGKNIHKKRLSAVIRFGLKWFLLTSILIILGLFFGGFIFLGSVIKIYNSSISWFLPWTSISILTGLSIILFGGLAFLEGIGKIHNSICIRLVSNLLGLIGISLGLVLNLRLWAPVAGSALICSSMAIGCLIYLSQPLYACWKIKPDKDFNWKNEIFPFQWRIAVSWVSGWFIFQSLTPVVLKSEGPAAAGLFGMAMQISNGISSIATSWTQTQFPKWGSLVATGQFNILKKEFKENSLIAVSISILLSMFCISILFIHGSHNFFNRLPSNKIFIPLAAVSICNTWVICMALYLRAFKKEPFMKMSLLLAIFIIAYISTGNCQKSVWLANYYALATFAVAGIFGSYIWYKNTFDYKLA